VDANTAARCSPTAIHALREWAFLQSLWTGLVTCSGQRGLSKWDASRGLKSASALGFTQTLLSECYETETETAMSMIKKSELICSRLRDHLRPWCPSSQQTGGRGHPTSSSHQTPAKWPKTHQRSQEKLTKAVYTGKLP